MALQYGTVRDAIGDRADEPPSRFVRREVVAGFRAQAGRVTKAIITGVRQAVPDMDRPLAGPVGEILSSAVQVMILHGVDTMLHPRSAGDDWTGMFRGVGMLAFDEGCSADTLHRAYEVGARIMCEQVVAYGRTHGVSAAATQALTGSIIRSVDRLATLSGQGYSATRSANSDAIVRRRATLLGMLLAGEQDRQALSDAAYAARWPVPEQVIAVALRRPPGPARPHPVQASVLADLDCAQPCFVIAADRDDPLTVVSAFPGWRAAIGLPVPVAEVRESLRIARRALDLAERGLIGEDPVISCADELLTLTLFADDSLIDQLVERRLAPLAGLTAGQRSRMLSTLHEWLITHGRMTEIAVRLGLHPQSVRYRVHQLKRLFHDQLTDPKTRFELEIAVRAALVRPHTDDDDTAAAC